jgi:hypothetical protein
MKSCGEITRACKHPVTCKNVKGGKMKITVEKSLVEFEPESDTETVMLEDLWKLMIDCARFNKKLVPVGEYIPQKKNLARFAIEN